jgi:gas vesicle protein
MKVASLPSKPEINHISRDSIEGMLPDDYIKTIVVGLEKVRTSYFNKSASTKSELNGFAESLLTQHIQNVANNKEDIDTEINIDEDDFRNMDCDYISLAYIIDLYQQQSTEAGNFSSYLNSNAYKALYDKKDMLYNMLLTQQDLDLSSLSPNLFKQLISDITPKIGQMLHVVPNEKRDQFKSKVNKVLSNYKNAIDQLNNENSPEQTQDYLKRKLLYQATIMRVIQHNIKKQVSGALGAHLHGPMSEYLSNQPEFKAPDFLSSQPDFDIKALN